MSSQNIYWWELLGCEPRGRRGNAIIASLFLLHTHPSAEPAAAFAGFALAAAAYNSTSLKTLRDGHATIRMESTSAHVGHSVSVWLAKTMWVCCLENRELVMPTTNPSKQLVRDAPARHHGKILSSCKA